MTTFNLIMCTCPDVTTSQKLAETLINKKIAACVNIIPQISSVYSWEGKLEFSTEQLLLIKTSSEKYSELEATINANHPYDCPEIIALPIEKGAKPYLNWIAQSVT